MAKALIITITPSLRISVGNGASTVEEETVVKSGDNAGKSKWTPIAHHGTLDDALRSVLRKHIDQLTTAKMWELRQARDEIMAGVKLLQTVCAGRLMADKRAAEAQLLELGEQVERLKAALEQKEHEHEQHEPRI